MVNIMKKKSLKVRFIATGCIGLILFIVSIMSLAVLSKGTALFFFTLHSLCLLFLVLQVLSPDAREEFYQDEATYPPHQGVFTDTLVDNLNKKVVDRDAQIERLKATIANQQFEIEKLKASSSQEVL